MDHSKIIHDDIFDDFTRDTVVFIPVDGSFEHRLESRIFPEGIKESSLHGKFIQYFGSDKMHREIDRLINTRELELKSPCEFPKASRRKNAALGECVTLRDTHGRRYCLVVASWLDKNGKAFLSNRQEEEKKIFEHILTKIIDHINREFPNAVDIRLPMLGTGVLRSQIKNTNSDYLRKTQIEMYEKQLKNCTWKIYEK